MRKNAYIVVGFIVGLLVFSPGSLVAQGIVIETGANIVATGAARIEITDGDFTNNGTYTAGAETITFSGTVGAVIAGSTNTIFHNLIFVNSAGIIAQISEISANDLTVSADGLFTIAAGSTVNVVNLTNSAGDTDFIILSDAAASGALKVSGTSSGIINYKRYLTENVWHLVSSPLTSQSINTYVTSGANSIATNDVRYGLAPYNTAIADWDHYTSSGGNLASAAGNFVSGKGYETLRSATAGTVDFIGAVSTSDVAIGVTEGANSWNLVGNPYPSPINGNDDAHVTNNFLTANTAALHDSYEAIYVWDPAGGASGEFITVNHVYNSNTAYYLAPGQGFFVYSVAGGSTVNFTEAMQSSEAGSFYKSEAIADFGIKLIAESDSKSAAAQIYFLDNASAGLDPGYDAGRFSGADNSFALYTHLVGDSTNVVNFDIQCLQMGEFQHPISIGLNASANTTIVFRTELSNPQPDVPVTIEDRLLGTYTTLHEAGSTYSVFLDEEMQGVGRFYLHTQDAETGIGSTINKHSFTLIPRPQYNTLRVINQLTEAAFLEIYDMSGHEVMRKNLEPSELNDLDMGALNSGIYVAIIRSAHEVSSKKFSWIH